MVKKITWLASIITVSSLLVSLLIYLLSLSLMLSALCCNYFAKSLAIVEFGSLGRSFTNLKQIASSLTVKKFLLTTLFLLTLGFLVFDFAADLLGVTDFE